MSGSFSSGSTSTPWQYGFNVNIEMLQRDSEPLAAIGEASTGTRPLTALLVQPSILPIGFFEGLAAARSTGADTPRKMQRKEVVTENGEDEKVLALAKAILGCPFQKQGMKDLQSLLATEMREDNYKSATLIVSEIMSRRGYDYWESTLTKMVSFYTSQEDYAGALSCIRGLISSKMLQHNKPEIAYSTVEQYLKVNLLHKSYADMKIVFQEAKELVSSLAVWKVLALEADYECLNQNYQNALELYNTATTPLVQLPDLNARSQSKQRRIKKPAAETAHEKHVLRTGLLMLYSAQTELIAGNPDRFRMMARYLIENHAASHPRDCADIFMHWAKVEVYLGNLREADTLLEEAHRSFKENLHSAQIRVIKCLQVGLYYQDAAKASDKVEEGLSEYPHVSRLWALKIQMACRNQKSDEETAEISQLFEEGFSKTNERAGDILCEYARWHMNPRFKHFNLTVARMCLDRAIEFYPEYSDSYIEYMRLLLLLNKPDEIDALYRLVDQIEYRGGGNAWEYAKHNLHETGKTVLMRIKEEVESQILLGKEFYERHDRVGFAFDSYSIPLRTETEFSGTEAIEQVSLKTAMKPQEQKLWVLFERSLFQ